MNLRIGGNPCSGRLANQMPIGLAHYTGRSFERPVISYSVQSKIDHRPKQVKNLKPFSVHISFTQVINKLLISPLASIVTDTRYFRTRQLLEEIKLPGDYLS